LPWSSRLSHVRVAALLGPGPPSAWSWPAVAWPLGPQRLLPASRWPLRPGDRPAPPLPLRPRFLALLLPSLLRFVAQPWALLFTLPRSADVLAHRYARVGVFPPLLPARHLAINGAMATPAALPPPVCVRPATSRQGLRQAKPGPIPFLSLLCYPGQLSRAINLAWRGHFYSIQHAPGSAI
jgi:hypothetical protein